MGRKRRHKMPKCSVNIHYHMMMGGMAMPYEEMVGGMEQEEMYLPNIPMERGTEYEYEPEMDCMPDRCRRCPYRYRCPGMNDYVCPGRY